MSDEPENAPAPATEELKGFGTPLTAADPPAVAEQSANPAATESADASDLLPYTTSEPDDANADPNDPIDTVAEALYELLDRSQQLSDKMLAAGGVHPDDIRELSEIVAGVIRVLTSADDDIVTSTDDNAGSDNATIAGSPAEGEG